MKLLTGGDSSPLPERETEYPSNELEEAKLRLDKLDVPACSPWPLIKTEFQCENGEDESPQVATKEVPYLATELARAEKGLHPHSKGNWDRICLESFTVWRTSDITEWKGGQRLWGTRSVFNHCRPPLTLVFNTKSHLLGRRSKSFGKRRSPRYCGDSWSIGRKCTKSGMCAKDVWPGTWTRVPVMILVDPEWKTPLIWGLPDSWKPIGIQLQRKIHALPQSERNVAAVEGVVSPGRRT